MLYMVCNYRYGNPEIKCYATTRKEANDIVRSLIANDIECHIYGNVWTVMVKRA